MRSKINKHMSITGACLLMKVSGFWIAESKEEQRRNKIALTYSFATLFFGLYVDIADIYYTWGDFGNVLYMMCNVLFLSIVLFKFVVLHVHKREFMDLVLYMREHFWNSNYDPREELILLRCQKLCTIIVVWTYLLVQGTCCGYVVTPLVANMERNKSDRMLPFNVWVDLPVHETPYYEIIFTVEILCVYQIGVGYVCFDTFLVFMNLHVACQFRILQHRLTTLGGPIDKRTDLIEYTDRCHAMMKKCVRQHQSLIDYCNKMENVFSLMVLGHIIVFSIVMCLVGYQILLAESTTTRRLIFIFHITGSAFQLMFFTYSCHGLIDESANVGVAIYSGPWTVLPMNKTGRILRLDMMTIILRSMQPCCLTACGFFTVSLETCTTVLSTAMSYFTLLRKSSVTLEDE